MKVYPSHKGSKPVARPGEALRDADFCRALLGILLMRNGGPFSFTQADFDGITGLHVLEGRDALGNFKIGLGMPVKPKGEQQ